MVNFNSTFESPSVIGGEKNVDFLKKRWLSIVDLYVMKILPENGDVDAFVEEMIEVESRAQQIGVKLQWTHEDDGSMAYVSPKEAKNTVYFNLRTLVFDSQHRGTLAHEFKHLMQERVTGDAYNPPGLNKLSSTTRRTLYTASGMSHLAIRDVLEGFVEWSTAVKHGENKNVAYTHLQVPEVKKLSNYVLEKTGVSLIACYVQMTVESMQRFERALTEAAYQTMLEQAASAMVKRNLGSKEVLYVKHIAEKLVADKAEIQSLEDATRFVRYTPVPDVAEVLESRKTPVYSEIVGEYDRATQKTENAKIGVNIAWEVIYPFADRVIRVLSHDGRTHELPWVALSA
jgi:hypothetical protein